MIAEGSIDVVVSNCVLNLVLVATEHKATLFDEIHRVLRRGGRAVISDIVSDVEVPETMRADPQLWSGCVSGAFQETSLPAGLRGHRLPRHRCGQPGRHPLARGGGHHLPLRHRYRLQGQGGPVLRPRPGLMLLKRGRMLTVIASAGW
jgi:SAM-dependent methyltransferase